MRLSSNRDDPGYAAFRAAMREGKDVTVWLDGARMDDVQIADEEESFIVRIARDAAGQIVLTPDRQAIVTERLNGAVRIDLAVSA